jgi:hypothetical protein
MCGALNGRRRREKRGSRCYAYPLPPFLCMCGALNGRRRREKRGARCMDVMPSPLLAHLFFEWYVWCAEWPAQA